MEKHYEKEYKIIPDEETSFEVRAGLQVYDEPELSGLNVSVVAATPWDILLRFNVPEGYCIKSYRYKNGDIIEEFRGVETMDKSRVCVRFEI